MSSKKKFLKVLVPVLALAAFLAIPAMAQATSPDWTIDSGSGPARITSAQSPYAVNTGNDANAAGTDPRAAGLVLTAPGVATVSCEIRDEGTISRGGADSITGLLFQNCSSSLDAPFGCTTSTVATPGSLPLATQLFNDGLGNVRDQIGTNANPVSVDITIAGPAPCPGGPITFSGVLTPKVTSGGWLGATAGYRENSVWNNDGSPQFSVDSLAADFDAGSGTLSAFGGAVVASVDGLDGLWGANGDIIDVGQF